jgi:hypothetical protein
MDLRYDTQLRQYTAMAATFERHPVEASPAPEMPPGTLWPDLYPDDPPPQRVAAWLAQPPDKAERPRERIARLIVDFFWPHVPTCAICGWHQAGMTGRGREICARCQRQLTVV